MQYQQSKRRVQGPGTPIAPSRGLHRARRPRRLSLRRWALWLAFVLLVLAAAGCGSGGLVFDPSKRVGSPEGHITDPERRASPTGVTARQPGSIALDDDLPQTGDSVRPGTGTFVRRVSPPDVDTTPGDVTLNFDGTDIREVVKVILGDLLGVNYVLDPAVSGSVSLQTGRPLRRDMLIPTLEMLLRMNNAALVDNAGTYEVVPLNNAVEGRIVPQLGQSSRALPQGYSVQVVPLQYIGAEEMASILEPMAPEGSIVRTDSLRNLIVVAGTSPAMSNLLDTIQVFDVDWMSGLSVGFFVLEYAKASEVVTQMETLLADGEGANPFKGLFRFIPVESANAVLVVSPQENYLAQMRDWIDRLDRAEASGSSAQRLFVYRVRHGDAENLADVLTKLFAGDGEGGQSRSVGGVAPGMQQASIGGNGEGGDQGGTAMRRATASQVQLSSEVSIVADTVNNSLLVRSSPKDYKKILDALKQLDIVPLQVLVEATIVEIRLTGDLRYGVQWRFFGLAEGGEFEGGRNQGGYRSDISLRDSADGPSQSFPGFNWSVVLRPDTIRATLSALASDDLVNVLSSPSVMVRDNQTAEIFVGEDVPVLTTQQQGTATTDRVVNNIEYRQTGVKLSVKPRVTPGGLVQMEIEQEVSSVSPEQIAGVDSPSFRERTITSNVSVRSSQAVVLGGLIQDNSSENKSGVPGLYRAPIIGPLFGETRRQATRTELVVVLTPRVIASDSDIETVTRDFREKVRNLDTTF
ncbi:type II secretion system protein GspD [Thiohalocapsa halophila]|uniref:Type II secretion system protein GspD n=1 Tax=Thiohalocapsa halophila TaxID=69359 RepID=A0ABS1CCB5_9GAMM|nr:type II secretion system protein GspD [Thiohalocapsa halophila]